MELQRLRSRCNPVAAMLSYATCCVAVSVLGCPKHALRNGDVNTSLQDPTPLSLHGLATRDYTVLSLA